MIISLFRQQCRYNTFRSIGSHMHRDVVMRVPYSKQMCIPPAGVIQYQQLVELAVLHGVVKPAGTASIAPRVDRTLSHVVLEEFLILWL